MSFNKPLSISSGTMRFAAEEAVRTIELAAEHGFQAIDMDLFSFREKEFSDIAKVKTALKDNGIAAYTAHAALNFSASFTSSGEKEKHEVLEEHKKHADAAAELGVKSMVIHISHQLEENSNTAKCAENASALLSKLLEYIGNDGLVIALENLPYENVDEISIKVQQMLNSEKVKFCYDSGHAAIMDNAHIFLNDKLSELVCVHLHDNNGKEDMHLLPMYEQGIIDWDSVSYALANSNIEHLNFEVMNKNHNFSRQDEFIKAVYDSAVKLRKKIDEAWSAD